jgi:uncharacterized membrane protein YgdD (TMEM256/DUF423 family)
MSGFWCRIAAALMALAVVMGAFGAHALGGRIEPGMLDVYRTAVLYHMVHALGLFVVAWILGETNDGRAEFAGCLLAGGIFLFSGSLYMLSLTGMRWLGFVTPLGGLCFIGGWGLLTTIRFTR